MLLLACLCNYSFLLFLTSTWQLFHARNQTSIAIITIARSKQVNRIRIVQQCCNPLTKRPLKTLLICEPIFLLVAKKFKLYIKMVSLLINKNIRFKALCVLRVAMFAKSNCEHLLACWSQCSLMQKNLLSSFSSWNFNNNRTSFVMAS